MGKLKPITPEVESAFRNQFSCPSYWSVEYAQFAFNEVRDGTHDSPKGVGEGIPLVTSKNLKAGTIDFINTKNISPEDHAEISKRSAVSEGDVLFSMIGTIGNVAIAPSEINFSVKNVGLFRKNNRLLEHRFSYYWLFSETYQKYLDGKKRGGNQKFVSLGVLRESPVLVPPLNEQIRIANKLDSLLAKVEAAQSRLEKIPVLLKRFRQSVLVVATSGELTLDWRENNTAPAWEFLTVGDIAEVKGGKRLPKGEKLVTYKTDFPYIKAGQLKKGTVDPRNQEYLEEQTQRKIARYTVSANDAYITIVGACIGDSGLIPAIYDGANLTENAAKICNFKRAILPKYLSFWLQSEGLQNQIHLEIKSGAQGKLALKRIKTLPVPFPSSKEQAEIVRRVESLFAQADKVEAQYQTAKTRLDKLTQSILAKAFRGELVPQDPNDEPASELLKRIQAEREEQVKAKPKQGRRKSVVSS